MEREVLIKRRFILLLTTPLLIIFLIALALYRPNASPYGLYRAVDEDNELKYLQLNEIGTIDIIFFDQEKWDTCTYKANCHMREKDKKGFIYFSAINPYMLPQPGFEVKYGEPETEHNLKISFNYNLFSKWVELSPTNNPDCVMFRKPI